MVYEATLQKNETYTLLVLILVFVEDGLWEG